MRRTLAEKVILDAIKQRISEPEQIAYVLRRVEEEIAKLRADLPDTVKPKEAELAAEQRRMANFVDSIGEGRGSQAIAKALAETERRVESLTTEVDGLLRSRDKCSGCRRSDGSTTGSASSKRSWSSARRSQHKRFARSWVRSGWS